MPSFQMGTSRRQHCFGVDADFWPGAVDEEADGGGVEGEFIAVIGGLYRLLKKVRAWGRFEVVKININVKIPTHEFL